jgi:hypothetical protein
MVTFARWLVVVAAACPGNLPAAPALAQASTAPDPSYRPPTNVAAIASARRAATEKLDDPASARVTDLKRKTVPNARGERIDVVCGMLDTKDSSGKYTGAKQFVYFVRSSEITLGHGDETDRTVVRNFCVGFSR